MSKTPMRDVAGWSFSPVFIVINNYSKAYHATHSHRGQYGELTIACDERELTIKRLAYLRLHARKEEDVNAILPPCQKCLRKAKEYAALPEAEQDGGMYPCPMNG